VRTRVAATILALLVTASAGGDVRGAGGFGRATEPDHLVPVDVRGNHLHNFYCRRVERLLRVPGWAEAVAICRPSFDPEESIAIHRAQYDPSRYVVTHARASRNIWYAMWDRNPRRRRVTVSRRDVPLPTDLGRRICRLWKTLLLETHNPAESPDFRAMDGTTYELHHHYLRGEAYDPTDAKGQRLILSLVDALLAYDGAGYAKRPEALKAVETKCRALEDYLAKRPPLTRPRPKPRPQPIPAMPAQAPGGITGLDVIPMRKSGHLTGGS
jgi:hypothetical protein